MPSYVTLEGVDWSGKSTQAALLADRLGAVLTREPGGTELGKQLRQLLLGVDEAPISPRAETLLMAADRAQHLAEVIRPALESGRHVVSDRSALSSLAYQGGGRGLGIEPVRLINEWALDGLWPDLAVFIDVDASHTAKRSGSEPDRLEGEATEFHTRTREAYFEMISADPSAWIVVDGTGTIDEVASRIWAGVEPRLAGGS